MTEPPSSRRRYISLFSLVMITIGAVDSIRNLPTTALFGSNIILFFILATFLFMLPCAFVSAELAANSKRGGGIYSWVSEAFGSHWGFLAVWFQWIENVVYFPGLLTFIAATVGYLISPHLADNKYYLVSFVLISFWLFTWLNLYGIRTSAWISSLGSVLGLLLPMVIIIICGVAWLISGKPIYVNLHPSAMLPNWHDMNIWVTVASVMLSLCGIEIATVHTRDIENPQKTFPRALAISTIIILMTIIFGALAIAMTVPQHKLSLVSGVMQAFSTFFQAYHLSWMLPLIGIALVLGGLGGLNSWLIAPLRGLYIAGHDGHLPKWLLKENRHHVPHSLLITQAIIVTAVSLLIVLMPTINSSYWVINVLATQLYMLMYVLMFITGVALRRCHRRLGIPLSAETYRVPGGRFGMPLMSLLGLIGCVFTILIGLLPPDSMHIHNKSLYALAMLGGIIVMSLPPVLLFLLQRQQKNSTGKQQGC